MLIPILVAFWLVFVGRLAVSWRRAARGPGRAAQERVRDDLASTVHRALEPAHVSVWVSGLGERRG